MHKIKVKLYTLDENKEKFNKLIGEKTITIRFPTIADEFDDVLEDYAREATWDIIKSEKFYGGPIYVHYTLFGNIVKYSHIYAYPLICINEENGDYIYNKDNSDFNGPYVLLDTIDKIKKFSNIAATIPSNVIVKSGRYVVDGKSIMGLFSLDLANPLKVNIDNYSSESTYNIFEEFVIFSIINKEEK